MLPPWAGRYVGLEFKENGRDIDGIDCWGLVRLILRQEFCIEVRSLEDQYRGVKNLNDLQRVIAEEKKSWQAISHGTEKLGDVIVIRNKGYESHVGLVLGGGEMLHIEIGINSVIKNYRELDVRSRIVGFYRHAGIADAGKENIGCLPAQSA